MPGVSAKARHLFRRDHRIQHGFLSGLRCGPEGKMIFSSFSSRRVSTSRVSPRRSTFAVEKPTNTSPLPWPILESQPGQAHAAALEDAAQLAVAEGQIGGENHDAAALVRGAFLQLALNLPADGPTLRGRSCNRP